MRPGSFLRVDCPATGVAGSTMSVPDFMRPGSFLRVYCPTTGVAGLTMSVPDFMRPGSFLRVYWPTRLFVLDELAVGGRADGSSAWAMPSETLRTETAATNRAICAVRVAFGAELRPERSLPCLFVASSRDGV